MFLEPTFDKLSAFEGFVKIYSFRKIAVWKFEPSEGRDCTAYVKRWISHTDSVNKTPTLLMLFCTLAQIFHMNTKCK